MRTNTLTKTTLTLASAALLAALPASAATINVDIQGNGSGGAGLADYTGPNANGPIASSTTWNHFNVGANPPSTSMLNLVDDSGATTTVDVAFGAGWTGSFADGLPNNLQGDRAFTVGSGALFTISGLDSGGTYNLAMMTGVNASGFFTSDFTIGATTLTADATSGAVGAANGALTFTDGVTHALFSGITASVGGEITFSTDYTGPGGGAAVLSGLQIQLVPEPSTFALFGLGILGFLRRRR